MDKVAKLLFDKKFWMYLDFFQKKCVTLHRHALIGFGRHIEESAFSQYSDSVNLDTSQKLYQN